MFKRPGSIIIIIVLQRQVDALCGAVDGLRHLHLGSTRIGIAGEGIWVGDGEHIAQTVVGGGTVGGGVVLVADLEDDLPAHIVHRGGRGRCLRLRHVDLRGETNLIGPSVTLYLVAGAVLVFVGIDDDVPVVVGDRPVADAGVEDFKIPLIVPRPVAAGDDLLLVGGVQ